MKDVTLNFKVKVEVGDLKRAQEVHKASKYQIANDIIVAYHDVLVAETLRQLDKLDLV